MRHTLHGPLPVMLGQLPASSAHHGEIARDADRCLNAVARHTRPFSARRPRPIVYENAHMTDRPDLRVVLADDHVATRAGVRRALEAGGIQIVAEVGTAAEAVDAAIRHRPDVCLIAAHVPGDGIAGAEQISEASPDTKIVILSDSERNDDLFAAVRAGAVGYLLTSTPAQRLSHTIRGVAHGEAGVTRVMAAQLLREFRDEAHRRHELRSASGNGVALTSRELDVMTLLRRQMGTAEIAMRLRIADVTVRRHVSAIMRKLEVSDRQSAVALLDRNGHDA